MAGLYDRWEDPNGNTISSFTIITTIANDLLSPIHDRMPVILPEEAEAAWINLEVDSPEELTAFIRPFPASSMESNEVSTQVNSPRNDGPELLTPGSGQLFLIAPRSMTWIATGWAVPAMSAPRPGRREKRLPPRNLHCAAWIRTLSWPCEA